MSTPRALTRLAKAEAYSKWKASSYALSELDDWCEENCATYEVEPHRLRAWIADAAANELSLAKLEGATDAQKTARLVGATLPKALGTLVDGLTAVNVKPRLNRNGEQVGEVETPNHEARIASAKEILKVLGAYAPEQLQVSVPIFEELAKKSRLEIEREIADLRRSTGIAPAAGIEGKDGGGELPVLASECDHNEGRTGRAEPVQAIPEPPLLSANPGRTQ